MNISINKRNHTVHGYLEFMINAQRVAISVDTESLISKAEYARKGYGKKASALIDKLFECDFDGRVERAMERIERTHAPTPVISDAMVDGMALSVVFWVTGGE